VYKGQGRNQRELMTQRLRGIPRSRRIIAIIDPHHDWDCRIPQSFRTRLSTKLCNTRYANHCSARAAEDIEGHHRPVIALSFLGLITHSPSKKRRDQREASHVCECIISLPTPSRNRVPAETRLFSRPRSRSLSELTRQVTPPTKNGHAPPSIESRKSYQSVNPCNVWPS
jgi:hypothetical protein